MAIILMNTCQQLMYVLGYLVNAIIQRVLTNDMGNSKRCRFGKGQCEAN